VVVAMHAMAATARWMGPRQGTPRMAGHEVGAGVMWDGVQQGMATAGEAEWGEQTACRGHGRRMAQ